MGPWRSQLILFVFLVAGHSVRAGVYYSGEKFAPLPSQWRGFLLDQRLLRQIAVVPDKKNPITPTRQRYEEEASRLEKLFRTRPLKGDEFADLGALYIRLGKTDKAIERLRAGQRAFPKHFPIVANLGSAWQLQGDLAQAEACLAQAVRLAPGKYQRAEEYHLKLVRLRRKQTRHASPLDDLFGVRFLAENGKYEPGKLAAAQRKRIPTDAAAIIQQLALWLPADGRLLWQLAELANVHGDARTAAAMMDGCVTQFGLNHADLRSRRRLTRATVLAMTKNGNKKNGTTDHQGHKNSLPARSKRPLLNRLDAEKLPAVSLTGINPLPWAVLSETTVSRKFRPTFAQYLKELDGKKVVLTGFMQPLGEAFDDSTFMLIEYPVGCWYCEMPEVSGIVFVELGGGKSTVFHRNLVKVAGTLKLNFKDPERFLYAIHGAQVAGVD